MMHTHNRLESEYFKVCNLVKVTSELLETKRMHEN